MNSKADKSSPMVDDNRRQFIKKIGLSLSGLAACSLVAGNGISSALAYSFKDNSADITGQTFNKNQMKILKSIADTILPETDTPSGAALDCHGFVDHQLKHCHSQLQRKQSITIVEKINKFSRDHYQQSFVLMSPMEKAQVLTNIEALKGFSTQDKQHFKLLKALIIFGFFTTEVGATQALNYQAVPGGFQGSIPYTKQSKAWGSLGFY